MKKVPEKNTQEKILDAAKKVFHRKGFEGARMQEIADHAHRTIFIKAGMIHSDNKNELNHKTPVFIQS